MARIRPLDGNTKRAVFSRGKPIYPGGSPNPMGANGTSPGVPGIKKSAMSSDASGMKRERASGDKGFFNTISGPKPQVNAPPADIKVGKPMVPDKTIRPKPVGTRKPLITQRKMLPPKANKVPRPTMPRDRFGGPKPTSKLAKIAASRLGRIAP